MIRVNPEAKAAPRAARHTKKNRESLPFGIYAQILVSETMQE